MKDDVRNFFTIRTLKKEWTTTVLLCYNECISKFGIALDGKRKEMAAIRTVLDDLEITAARVPEKIAFADETSALTFSALLTEAQCIGTFLARKGFGKNRPIAVLCDRSPQSIALFLGVIYSGNFYVPIDRDCPAGRLETMLSVLTPAAILATDETSFNSLSCNAACYTYTQMKQNPSDTALLAQIREAMMITDPLFAIFTSGSTGTPKCVLKSHLAMQSFIDDYTMLFDFGTSTVFGNQTPFYFDASTKDIFATLRTGATTYIIPKKAFSFPMKLIDFLNEHHVNTVVWVPSVLSLVATFGVLEEKKPHDLKTVLFVGEVMPPQHLAVWMQALPETVFVNLYGTTESAGNCLYHVIDKNFDPNCPIPLGRPFPHTNVFLLDGDSPATEGELCISAPTVALGYYGDPDGGGKFCQNPLHMAFSERICRTGDMARQREDGIFEFVSRKDFQIKHMGYRIELGDIEEAALSVQGIHAACCVYDAATDRLILYFVGADVTKQELKKQLREKLPKYMLPQKTEQLEQLPFNANGKIDRKRLLEQAIQQK